MMQYQITLPADYDMDVIRARVARNGHLLDGYEGLGLKAYLIRERGVDGAPVNQYAPFYLWADAAAAASFLWSGVGFAGIVRDFGRPPVQTWIGGTHHPGSARAEVPTHALRTAEPLPADADPTDVAAATDTVLRARRDEAGLHSASYGIDPRTWELVQFSLHAGRPEAAGGELYQVLHLSAPGCAALPDAVRTRLPSPPVEQPVQVVAEHR
jgi:hypothetical protein